MAGSGSFGTSLTVQKGEGFKLIKTQPSLLDVIILNFFTHAFCLIYIYIYIYMVR